MKRRHLLICIFSLFYPFPALAQQTASDFDKSGDAKQQKGDYAGASADYAKAAELMSH